MSNMLMHSPQGKMQPRSLQRKAKFVVCIVTALQHVFITSLLLQLSQLFVI